MRYTTIAPRTPVRDAATPKAMYHAFGRVSDSTIRQTFSVTLA
jgi:hypothetical protein